MPTIPMSKMLREALLSLLLALTMVTSVQAHLPENNNGKGKEYPLVMPGVAPLLPQGESYLCTGVGTPSDTHYITDRNGKDPTWLYNQQFIEGCKVIGFSPRANRSRVHHMMVVGCDTKVELPSGSQNLWNCGGTLGEQGLWNPKQACPGSSISQTIYMWSLEPPDFDFPADVSVAVGGDSAIQHLVIQVHYISNDGIDPDVGDWSGVRLKYTDQKTEKLAGVFSLHVHGRIAPGSRVAWDSLCRLGGAGIVHPFAFLGHTHAHGKLVSGWKIDHGEKWSPIGFSDPRRPQNFLPVMEDIRLRPGDVVGSRCILETTEDENEVVQGLTSYMEMCDFFVYFWVDTHNVTVRQAVEQGLLSNAGLQCTNKGPPDFTWENHGFSNIPRVSTIVMEPK